MPAPLSPAAYRRNRLVGVSVAALLTATLASGWVGGHGRAANTAVRPANAAVRPANSAGSSTNTAGSSTKSAGSSTNTAGRAANTAGRSTNSADVDRCQPPPRQAFGYRCGPVEDNPRIRLIYWGKWGKKWALQRTEVTGAVAGFFAWLPHSPYQTLLSQYYDQSGHIGLDPKLVSTTTDNATSPPKEVGNNAVIDEVSRLIRHNNWPSGGVNNQYVVITPPGSTYTDPTTDTTFCGWHENVGLTPPLILIYVPYPNSVCGTGQPTQDVISELSHEEIDTQANPVGYEGWSGIPHLSNVGASIGQVLYLSDPAHEIGDLCHNESDPGPIAQPVSLMWDMQAGVCANSAVQVQQERGAAARAGLALQR